MLCTCPWSGDSWVQVWDGMGKDNTVAGSVQPPQLYVEHDPKVTFCSHVPLKNILHLLFISIVYLQDQNKLHLLLYVCLTCIMAHYCSRHKIDLPIENFP